MAMVQSATMVPFYNEGGVQIGTFSNSVARVDSNTVITQVACQRLLAHQG